MQPLPREADTTIQTEIDPDGAMPRKRKRKNVAVLRLSCCNDTLCDENVADPHVVSLQKRKRKIAGVSRSQTCSKRIGSIHPV